MPTTQLGEAIHSESPIVNYEGGETIRLADARTGADNNGYVLASTEGEDEEIDDEADEERGLVQSEMDGFPQTQHRAHDLSAKAGIILVCQSTSPIITCTNGAFLAGTTQHLHRGASVSGHGNVIDNLCLC